MEQHSWLMDNDESYASRASARAREAMATRVAVASD
jgi:hypothetical protein